MNCYKAGSRVTGNSQSSRMIQDLFFNPVVEYIVFARSHAFLFRVEYVVVCSEAVVCEGDAALLSEVEVRSGPRSRQLVINGPMVL